MTKKTFIILILPALALVVGFIIKETMATSNPHSWDNGLIGYWSFDGQNTTSTGTRDMSGNDNWGSISGATPIAGIVGQALSFDGSDDYVDSAASIPLNGTGSLEGWLYLEDLAQDKGCWCLHPYGSFIYQHSANNYFYFYGTAGYIAWVPSKNTWYHLVITYDGDINTAKAYVNGVEKGVVAGGGSQNIQSWTGIIGDPSLAFDGIIDEVRAYNRVLSKEEVKQHYEQTRRNVKIDSTQSYKLKIATANPHDWSDGLVGYWDFNGQNTTSSGTRDMSGNDNWGSFYKAVKPTAGIVGQALSFDGVKGNVRITHDASLNFGTGNFSFEFWIKRQGNWTAVPHYNGLLSKIYIHPEIAGSYGWFLMTDNNSRIRPILKASDVFVTAPSVYVPLNEWAHVVFTVSRSGSAVHTEGYLNGVFQSQSDYTSSNSFDNTQRMMIYASGGNSGWDYTPNAPSLMDEVRIYNRALSAEEVKMHYDQTRRNLSL